MAHKMGCIIPIWPQESASAGPLLPVPGQSAVAGRAALLAVADQAAPQPGLVAVLLVLTGAPSLRLQDLRDLGHHIWGDVNTLLDAILNLKLPKLRSKYQDTWYTCDSNSVRRLETCWFLIIFWISEWILLFEICSNSCFASTWNERIAKKQISFILTRNYVWLQQVSRKYSG